MYIHAGETWFDVTCEFYLCLVWDFFEDGRSSDSPVGGNFASPHWYVNSFCLSGFAIVTSVGQVQSFKFYHPIIKLLTYRAVGCSVYPEYCRKLILY